MKLPFTREQFFDLFAAYNAALWPAVVALWIASVVASVLLFASRRPPGRWISALLAAHWTWSALAYHVAFFSRINPAAWVFAALFLLQAALFFWWGVVQARLSFAPWRPTGWASVAWVLIAYSLAYPGINAAQHLASLMRRRAIEFERMSCRPKPVERQRSMRKGRFSGVAALLPLKSGCLPLGYRGSRNGRTLASSSS